jgi:glycogen debranching enzyme
MNRQRIATSRHPPLPRFTDLRDRLPSPLYDEQPRWVELYWKAWELAFDNFRNPAPGSTLVSPFIDAAFNKNIFQWDSCFMTMFCDVAFPLVPGISTLDNFYARQHEDGEICREIRRDTGIDFIKWQNTEDLPLFSRWGFNLKGRKSPFPVVYEGRTAPEPNPRLTLDGLNHPLFAWSELEHHRWTGDRARLATVRTPLTRYYRALEKYLRQGNGLYMTDWASMDNSPRNPWLDGGGTGVDSSSEMVLFARQLAEIGEVLGHAEEAGGFRDEADDLASRINRLMWSDERRFYFDLTRDGRQAPVRTVAAFWTLLAGVASADRAQCLVDQLSNPSAFGRLNPVPTCAADEPGYETHGGYWRGAAWAPTNTMVIRGLERFGYGDLAREIALKHIRLVADVFASTGTIWENYAPDSPKPGKIRDGIGVRRDFVGWSGIGPILYLLEHAIGLRPSAPENLLSWRIASAERCGCAGFRFGGHVATLVAEPADPSGSRKLTVESDGSFTLEVAWRGRQRTVEVAKGRVELVV